MKSRKISQKTHQRAPLEDYQREIHVIWPELATRPALHTWARVVQHGTTACEGMRRSDWSLVLQEIAKTIVWWLAFIEKANLLNQPQEGENYHDDFVFALPISATAIVWSKYPGVCPVEFGLAAQDIESLTWEDRPAQTCMCLGRKKDVEERSADEKRLAKETLRVFARRQRRRRPRGIDQLENMLQNIFAGAIYHLSFQELFFHLMEEIGEVSEALADATTSEWLSVGSFNKRKLINERKQKIRAVTEELADVFSWCVGIVTKVQAHLVSFESYLDTRHEGTELHTVRNILKGSQHISLSGAIWQQYGLGHNELRCADCGERPCMCIQQRAQPLYANALDMNKLLELSKIFQGVSLD